MEEKKITEFGKAMIPIIIFFAILTAGAWYIVLSLFLSGNPIAIIIAIPFAGIALFLTITTFSFFAAYLARGTKKISGAPPEIDVVYK